MISVSLCKRTLTLRRSLGGLLPKAAKNTNDTAFNIQIKRVIDTAFSNWRPQLRHQVSYCRWRKKSLAYLKYGENMRTLVWLQFVSNIHKNKSWPKKNTRTQECFALFDRSNYLWLNWIISFFFTLLTEWDMTRIRLGFWAGRGPICKYLDHPKDNSKEQN